MTKTAKHRPVRSYVRREGRITDGQSRALEHLLPKYGIAPTPSLIEFDTIFANSNSVILEIGFGNGELLAGQAEKYPAYNYLGIEVHRPGIGRLLQCLEKRDLNNVRIMSDDAMEILRHRIPENSLQEIWLFFPDPWPKKKHHKRRIFNTEFLDLAANTLKDGGLFRFATDWQDYANWTLELIQSDKRFSVLNERNRFSAEFGNRPVTKFERRGTRLGHGINDMTFKRQQRQQFGQTNNDGV
ncbi:MAG: tRNA (guanosine(46)-N7)-methyltransferase TrmB [Gammaproteobacteria bacterium]|nr:MAG: tRNA (guanosine(46)-N7)-methyltransferase TrmB [Gammaproteobacteria bacterium]